MILMDILNEVDIADRLTKDPQKLRLLSLAMRHDRTLPRNIASRLGPKHTDAEAARLYSDSIEGYLARTRYGDLSRDYKFADWLTRLYLSGGAEFEDIKGEAPDALGAWHALSVRGLLKPPHTDLNRFPSIRSLLTVVDHWEYRDMLRRIGDEAKLAQMKKDAKSITLIDDPRFSVIIPLTYGACYLFNMTGHTSSFCTGSSSGQELFNDYSGKGPIISILDKQNQDDVNGKWQMSAGSGQLYNSHQQTWPLPGMRSDEAFARLFPGLMRRIADAMREKAPEIDRAGESLRVDYRGDPTNWYDVENEIDRIKQKFPVSWASKAKDKAADEPQPEAAPQQAAEPQAPWYQRYLHPEFRNNLPEMQPGQRLRLKAVKLRQDGSRKAISGLATGLDDLLTRIRDLQPGWLEPGTLITVEPRD